MDDAALVSGFEGIRNLTPDAESFIYWQRASRSRPLDVLHHEIIRTHVMKCADIGMVQRCDDSRLALESLAEALRRHFHGDIATQPWISRSIYLPHPAGTEKFQNFVG